MIDEFIAKANSYGKSGIPFFFAVDFDVKNFIISSNPKEILYDIDGLRNYEPIKKDNKFKITLNPQYIDFATYKRAFERVIEEIKKGNTYLLNLTFETKLDNDLDLEKIFFNSDARYKLYIKNRLICFSPERFIKITGNKIETHPMKGTIDAKVPNAKEKILNDPKEMSEHLMVVDLLRNDLSMVSKRVRVEKYRYIQKIKAGKKELLQVSSKITGQLDEDWREKIGEILIKILPAGSITGTPKRKTVELINKIENYKRGFFTGVFGYFDGQNLDSAVLIRYIEKRGDEFFFKSGGGVTLMSDAKKEYEELKDKVYVSLF